jgi:small multidrug resistance pump
MHWMYLIIAIVLEVAGTTSMKLAEGFTKPLYSVLLFVFYLSSFAVLTLALKKIDVSLAYAIWAGAGTALIAAIGIFYFNEPVSLSKILGVVLIVGGVVALNLSGGSH